MPDYTILLIDYEPRSLERTRRPLATAGYRVEIARDGLAGMEAFERIKPDLVLVEAMIPKKHGFEVCQDLKKTPQGKRTPILITTAVYKGRKYRSQALHLYGCDEYLEKPVPEEQLVSVCARFLQDPDAAGRLARLQGLADPTPAAPEPETAAVAAHAEQARAGDAEQEILARLDAILPDRSGGSEEPEIEVLLDEPNAAHPDAPRAEVAPPPPVDTPKQVISLDEARARKRHKKGRHGSGRAGRGGAAANPEPVHSIAEPVGVVVEPAVAQAAPSPVAETRLLPDPVPLPDVGSQTGLPGWVWCVAAAGLLGVFALLWLMLS
ncbi:MAG TPA: response regulator [Candidatus Polarisedimenticolaceae bacterium]|nr:response regulator [Candidatus Polarisedimenticolaceae bacterium]